MRNRKLSKCLGIVLSAAMVCSSFYGLQTRQMITAEAAYSADSTQMTVDSDMMDYYGLQEDIQDGVILHCWDWSYENIASNMEAIAEAGYTAVQTSPIQQAKESTVGKLNSTNWWVFYQPAYFCIDDTGTSALGTKSEFEEMVETAHSYGVKVIVDIVANHTANNSGYDIGSMIDSDLYNNQSVAFHSNGLTEISDYSSDRYRITQYSMGGLPDLNTESSLVQGKVLSLLEECIDCGADGFRFDAAKHIGVPSDENGASSSFWTNTLQAAQSYASSTYGKDIYAYGECLGSPGGSLSMTNYTNLMSITESTTSSDIRSGVTSSSASSAAKSSYNYVSSASKAVLWAESHDTYEDGSTSGISVTNINKIWALVASKTGATSLYFARPGSGSYIGSADTTDWKDTEVAAVNNFHNYYNGQTEYLGYSGSIVYNQRGDDGIVLVNVSGTSTIVSSMDVSATGMEDGTYTDQVSGNTFTVSSGCISGSIGSTGVAVVYNAESKPANTISQSGGSFKTDTLTLTLGLSNATSGTYQIGSASAVTYTSSTSITIGSDMEVGDSVTIYLTATDGSTTSTSYTFTKKEDVDNIAYLSLPSGWSTPVYCYAYDDNSNQNAAWPGEAMTYDSSTGYYYYTLPDDLDCPYVIFTDTSNQYPGANQTGLQFTTDGSWLYKDGTWSTYSGGSSSNDDEIPDVIYLQNDYGWSTVVAYMWNSSSLVNNTWPGVAMTLVDSDEGIYSIETSSDYDMIIFDNGTYGSGNQTGDLTIPTDGTNMYNNSTGTWSTYTATCSITVNEEEEEEALVNNSFISQEAVVGEKIVFKGAATGGSGSYQYAYYYRKTTDTSWTTAGTEWGTSAYATAKPGTNTVYEVCIKVRDANNTSNVVKKYLSFAANNTETSLKCYGSVYKTIYKYGITNYITASSAGNADGSTVQYKYEYRKASSWTYETIQDYSEDTQVSWDAPQTGSFTLRITAYDGTDYAIRTINIKVKPAS